MQRLNFLAKATSVATLFVSFCMPSIAVAATGDPELALVQNFLTGNFGFLIGLATAFAGVYKIGAKADAKGGALLIILGVLFTMIPAIYNGTRIMVCPIAKALAPSALCN